MVGQFLGRQPQVFEAVLTPASFSPAKLLLQFLLQALAQLVEFGQVALAQQHSGSTEHGRWHPLTDGQGPEAAGVQQILDLGAAMPAGLAPMGEVFAVVEQQVVILFAQAPHGPPQGYAGRGAVARGIGNHRYRFAAAEIGQGAAQDFAPFQVVGHAAVA